MQEVVKLNIASYCIKTALTTQLNQSLTIYFVTVCALVFKLAPGVISTPTCCCGCNTHRRCKQLKSQPKQESPGPNYFSHFAICKEYIQLSKPTIIPKTHIIITIIIIIASYNCFSDHVNLFRCWLLPDISSYRL